MFGKILAFTLLLATGSLGQSLNFYYGNLHSHSSYSDGNKDSATSFMTTPIQDFMYAKLSLHTDFYGISEHNHSSAGSRGTYYFDKGLDDADSATIDGSFVALYGMEWGVISSGGHVLLYGFDSLCGWDFNNEIHIDEANYTKLWKTINRKKNTFAYLAHPQSNDYDNILNLPVKTFADSAIVGMAMRSGPAFSTNNTYSNPATSTYLSRYNDALKQGYHVGPGLDHDTHNSVFDRQSDGRLVIMAPILNRAELIEGMRQMRFYSSDDWNTHVNFVVNNLPMGSIIKNAGNPTINVSVNDLDGELINSIAIYYGVPGSGIAPTLLNSISNSGNLSYTHQINNGSNYYYYLYIVEADGDKIWTSPIWYERNDSSIVQIPIANFMNTTKACANYNYTLQDSSLNNPNSWWWTIQGGYPSNSSLQNPEIKFSSPGNYIVSLTVSNQAGVSNTITKTITVLPPPTLTVNGNMSICKGSNTQINLSGALNYLWNTGSTDSSLVLQPNTTTKYTVKGTDSYCYDTLQFTIYVSQVLTTPVIYRQMDSDTLYSSNLYGNQWYNNSTIISGANQNYLVPAQAGLYRVNYSDTLGCVSEFSPYFSFLSYSSIDELDATSYISFYPNPTSDYINIKSFIKSNKLELNLFDAQGKIILNENFENITPEKNFLIDLRELDKGVYLLKANFSGKYITHKIKLE